jgi:hypothetical protein
MFQETLNTEDTLSAGSNNPFRIVTIYDSAKTSAEAARASAVVIRELGDEVPVDRCSWNVASLESDLTRGFAAAEAARADLIVVALSDGSPSNSLRDWVTRWGKKRTLENGLFALIPTSEHQASAALENYFYEAAVTANMDFLCRKRPRY